MLDLSAPPHFSVQKEVPLPELESNMGQGHIEKYQKIFTLIASCQ